MPEKKKTEMLAVVILAAGKGTRMNTPNIAKVMYGVNGKPMVEYVVELASKMQADRILVVVGWQKQSVIDHLSKLNLNVEFVDQQEQLGTGHAVLQAETVLKEFSGDVLVLSGDVPLLTLQTVQALVGYHHLNDAAASILTAEMNDPSGYGRIIRNKEGFVQRIVEHKDATMEEKSTKEINTGIYVFTKEKLFEALRKITTNNAQGEYYLTDVFEYFWKNQWRVSAVKSIDAVEVMGINNIMQLDAAREVLAARSNPKG